MQYEEKEYYCQQDSEDETNILTRFAHLVWNAFARRVNDDGEMNTRRFAAKFADQN